MAKTALQFRHNDREVAVFVEGGDSLLSALRDGVGDHRPNSAAARVAAAPARC